jgi:hypothetical protein
VPDHIDLGYLDFVHDLAAPQRRRQRVAILRHVEIRQFVAASSALRMLEDQSFATRALRHGSGCGIAFENRGHRRSREIAAVSAATN